MKPDSRPLHIMEFNFSLTGADRLPYTLPSSLGYTPPHPDDLSRNHGAETATITGIPAIASEESGGIAVGLNLRPPLYLFRRFAIGYRHISPQTREGTLTRARYRSPEDALTYVRQFAASGISQWRASYSLHFNRARVVSPIEIGTAYSTQHFGLARGWDRFSRLEQAGPTRDARVVSVSYFIAAIFGSEIFGYRVELESGRAGITVAGAGGTQRAKVLRGSLGWQFNFWPVDLRSGPIYDSRTPRGSIRR